jgi:lipopolysaccharide/colanic/teichoic acid biosynthesis glycosyltransferase
MVGFVALWRLISFVFLVQPGVKEAATSRILVVGWNEKVTQLWKAMRRDIAQLGEIVGSVPMPEGTFAARPPAELAVLGDYFDLPSLVAECQVNAIILADVTCSAVDIQSLIGFCQREMIAFQMVPEYFPALSSGLRVQTLSGVPLLGVSELPLDRTLNRMIKRSTDIVVSLFGLLLSAFIVPIFAAAIYLQSPGPIFQWQRRTSRGGKSFNICKIRTTEVVRPGPALQDPAPETEPRVLWAGKMMQEFYIDSLPRFWSVLMGDMSLVGPAPEHFENAHRLKTEIPNYSARHEIRPGLTGWAQIQGLQRDADPGRRTEADLYYLENWTVWLDLYCVLATLLRTRSLRD